jgi:hypothetical protein
MILWYKPETSDIGVLPVNRTVPVLWAKHLVKAAIDYFTERSVGACILIDNALLKDVLLASFNGGGYGELTICISPGFVTRLEFGDEVLTLGIRLNHADQVLSIPYHAIRAIVSGQDTYGAVSGQGELNVIAIPPVVYPPGSPYRKEGMQSSPLQAEPQRVASRS